MVNSSIKTVDFDATVKIMSKIKAKKTKQKQNKSLRGNPLFTLIVHLHLKYTQWKANSRLTCEFFLHHCLIIFLTRKRSRDCYHDRNL